MSCYFCALPKHKIEEKDDKMETLPPVHLVISLRRRWIMGTLQGSCSKDHLAYYFDEYTFRFNRRKSNSRGLLFYRLIQNAIWLHPVTYQEIIRKYPHLCDVNTQVGGCVLNDASEKLDERAFYYDGR
jgi:hypothetical protein